MNLPSYLEYEFGEGNLFQRGVAAFTSTRLGAWLGYYLVPPLDRLSLRLSGGRGSATEWLSGIAPLKITTTGAKTGRSRQTLVFGIPVGDHLALIGSGFGQKPTPSWVYNIEAHPDARIDFGGRSVAVVARASTGVEAESVWDVAARVYPGFVEYRARASHREIKVFVLEPVVD
jgi:deazaflavin-dependent oxidoreductase (nitroreductase family)